MKNITFAFLLLIFIVCSTNICLYAQSDRPEITPVLQQTLSGPDLKNHNLVTFQMELKPNFSNTVPHRHSGNLFGYVISGQIEIAMESRETKIYDAGEMFHEKNLELHTIYKIRVTPSPPRY